MNNDAAAQLPTLPRRCSAGWRHAAACALPQFHAARVTTKRRQWMTEALTWPTQPLATMGRGGHRTIAARARVGVAWEGRQLRRRGCIRNADPVPDVCRHSSSWRSCSSAERGRPPNDCDAGAGGAGWGDIGRDTN